MGFAGQVFAARVAIGLAVPSPQALSKTGGMLAQGVSNIAQQVRLAQNKHGLNKEYLGQLGEMNAKTLSTTDKINNEITVRMKRHLDKVNQQVAGSVEKSTAQTAGAFTKLKAVLSKPLGNKLTKGMGVDPSMTNAYQLAKNLQGMTRQNHQAILSFQSDLIDKQELFIANEMVAHEKKIDLGDTAKGYKKGEREAEEDRINQLKRELEIDRELLAILKNRVGLINQLKGDYSELAQYGKEWAESTVDIVNTLRSKFNAALRNTIALLTALTYKLNQSTQELIEFERELLNANSVFGLTNDQLFEVGNTVVEFGNQYGIATQNGAAGLYQLASAGLTANEAMEVLPHTLKLSMAVQGDHNTISKLTAQTIFGFGMEMSDAAEITDKFAYAIQKSLIEYQDLSSAVKFALPFFTSTGQSLDQLLGALQILTNRALEAGIAGRGLRQALAEFAESAMDAEAGFRKMGVEILNAQGEMKQLDEIAAQFASSMGEDITNTELLTTLIQDLNVRGATAFIHLVQASDEFTEAVKATENAGGELDKMVRIQNESLSAQIQILKTNVFSIFALRDAAYEGTEYINGFHEAVVNAVAGLRDMIVEGEEGAQQLTEFGQSIQDFAIDAVEGLMGLVMQFIEVMKDLAATGAFNKKTLDLLLIPLRLLARIMEITPDWVMNLYLKFRLLNMVIPIQTMLMWGLAKAWGAYGMSMMTATGMSGMGGLMAGGPWGMKVNKAGRFYVPGKTGGYGFATKKALMAKVGGRGLGMAIPGIGGLMALWLAYDLAKSTNILQSGGYVKPMAQGGQMGGSSPYLVGEQGPELFIPGQSGQMLNTAQTNNLMGNGIVLKNVTIGIDSFGGIA